MNALALKNAVPTAPVAPAPTGGELRHQAEVWVAQTFFGQVLKQLRDSPFKSDLFDGGRGGQAFRQMHDGLLAQRMTRGVGRRLVDPIVRQLEAGRAYRSASAAIRGDAREPADRQVDRRAA